MIVTKRGEIVYNLTQLFALRNNQIGNFVKLLKLLTDYLQRENIHPYPSQRYTSFSLRKMLDDGWVGSMVVDRTKRQLLGVMLAKVHYEDGVVVGSVLRNAVRKNRPGDIEVGAERFAYLGRSLRDQVVNNYFFESVGWMIEDEAMLCYCVEALSAGKDLEDVFLSASSTDMSLRFNNTNMLHIYIWDAENTRLVPVVG